MLSATDIDTEQEYLCKFTTAQGSIFWTVTDAEREGLRDFLLEDEEEEKYNYEIALVDLKDALIFEN